MVNDIMTTIESGREEIYGIADTARNELARLQGELEQLKSEILSTIAEVESCEREERMARVRLMEVSRDFQAYSEEDIKQAYEEAHRLQVQLSALREKEKQLRHRRDELERHLKQVESIARKAEGLVDRINMVLKMLKGNVGVITGHLEEANKKQQLGLWVIQAQEEERRRISRELHDGPAQNLANIVMRLELMERLWDKDLERVRRELAELKEVVRQNLSDIRRVIFDLRPMALDDLGLVPAIKRYLADYAQKYDMEIDFLFFGEERRLDLAREVAVFRLIQEAITNVRKHAGTDRAQVKLGIAPEKVTVVIKDEGCGFDVEAVREGKKESFGLLGMQERVGLFGGKFRVKSAPGQGTQVIIEVPLEREGEGNGQGKSAYRG
nr:sensor histidine kinase [Syntrophothermus sp.]